MPIPLAPLLIAGARAFGASAAAARAGSLAATAYKHRTLAKPIFAGGEEDPRAIVADALAFRDGEDLSKADILARARLRSHSGRLLAKVQEIVDERQTGIGIPTGIGSIFG
jgi:hypothetical protein